MDKLSWIILLQYLLVTADGLTSGIMIELGTGGVPGKNSWLQRMGRVSSYWMMELLLMIPKLVQGQAVTSGISQVLQVLAYLIMTKKLYSVSWLGSLKWFAMYLVASQTGELLVMSAHPQEFASVINWTREPMLFTLIETEISMFCFKILLTVMICRKKKRWLDPWFFGYAVYCAALVLIYPILVSADSSQFNILARTYVPFILLICVVTFVLMSWRLIRLYGDLRAERQILENGHQTVNGSMTDEPVLSKLRHDSKNIELTLTELIENDQIPEALEMIDSVNRESDRIF